MKKLLEILDQAPNNAFASLQNKTDLSLESTDTQYSIGGHKLEVKLNQITEIILNRQKSFIRDYIVAKENLLKELKRVNIIPMAVLPADIFFDILDQCNLVRFESLDENGTQMFDYNYLHLPFAKLLGAISFCPYVVFYKDGNPKSCIITPDMSISLSFIGCHNEIVKGKILDYGRSVDDFHVLVRLSEGAGFSYKFSMPYSIDSFAIGKYRHRSITKPPSETFGDLVKSYIDDNLFYKIISQYLIKAPEDSGLSISNGKISVLFPKMPDDIKEMLLRVHEELPHWKLYTAATANAFTISMKNGEDLRQHSKESVLPIWIEVYERILKKHGSLLEVGELERYLSEHEKSADNDPIFYYITKTQLNNVEYKHAVVFGQYGDFPNEKKAVEIAQQYSKGYEGILYDL